MINQKFSVDSQRQSYNQPYARAFVYLSSYGIQLLPALEAQVRVFGQTLAHQVILILIRALLSRAVLVTKVHSNARVLIRFLKHRHLGFLVVDHR